MSTSAAFKRYLGVNYIGLRTPHGYSHGLIDRPEMLEALQRSGIVYVSSWVRNAQSGHPTPLSVQPYGYAEQGFADLLEIPFQH